MDKSLSIRPYTLLGSTESADAFSRIFVYQPIEEELLRTRGEVYAIFSSAIPGAHIDWEKVALQSFETLRSVYYQPGLGSNVNALTEALERSQDKFIELTNETAKLTPQRSVDIHIGVLVVWGGSFMFDAIGHVYAALFREEQLVPLTQGHVVQEPILPDDSLLLGTTIFGERVDISTIQKIIQSNLADDWQKLVRHDVNDMEENALLSGIILHTKVDTLPDAEEIIEISMPGSVSQKRSRKLPAIRFRSLLAPFRRLNQVHMPELKVRTHEPPRRFMRWGVFAVFIVLLIGSIAITVWRNQQQTEQVATEETHSAVLAELARVHELAQKDPLAAHQLFMSIQDAVGEVQGVHIEAIQDELYETEDVVYKTVYAQPVESLSGNYTEQSILSGNQHGWALLDSQTGTLWRGDNNGVQEMASGGDLQTGSFLEPNTVGYYVLRPGSGIWLVNQNTRQVEKLIDQTNQFDTAADISTYLDNLYVLAPEHKTLAKYIGLGNGRLGGAVEYFQEPVIYETMVDIAIDGHVYVLHQDGRVEKFLGGKRVPFSLRGVVPEFQEVQELKTFTDAQFLYLLADNAVHVFTVEGEYQRRIKVSEGTIQDFIPAPDETGVYVLVNGRLLRSSL